MDTPQQERLYQAVVIGDLAQTRALLNERADPDVAIAFTFTRDEGHGDLPIRSWLRPLNAALNLRNALLMQLLLEHGASPYGEDVMEAPFALLDWRNGHDTFRQSATPSQYACALGLSWAQDLLIQHSAVCNPWSEEEQRSLEGYAIQLTGSCHAAYRDQLTQRR